MSETDKDVSTEGLVAKFISAHVNYLTRTGEKTQREIAQAIGYSKPNIITMFKQGLTRLPLNKIGPLARALDTDPTHLLRLFILDYQPENMEVVEDLIGRPLITAEELAILRIVRDHGGGLPISPQNDAELEAFLECVRTWRTRKYRELLPENSSLM